MVKVGGVRLHVNVVGEGSPVVVFEAGIAATSLSWRPVQLEISKLTTTASYDRAGLGWSDASSSPRGIGQVVEELHALLDCAGLAGPWILVSHSYGGLVARVYVQRYPAEVAGMVLADPVTAREWAEPSESNRKLLRRGIRLSRRGALLARVGLVRLALSLLSAGARRAPKLIARATSGHAVAFIERILGEIRKLPPEIWPLIQAHWSDPKCFEATADYLEGLPEGVAGRMRLNYQYPGGPLQMIEVGQAGVANSTVANPIAICMRPTSLPRTDGGTTSSRTSSTCCFVASPAGTSPD
jgi:pimeloyl-ACP methyl ester carboxylesterase